MHYEGPIYRPPSEADSLLIQATVGCPHNKCSFCMIYKRGPAFRVRPTEEIIADLEAAAASPWGQTRTLFLPSGNTMAMPTDQLASVCRRAYELLPRLERITVYGSSACIAAKSPDEMKELARAGLGRVHLGLESGSDKVLAMVKKGTDAEEQLRAARMVLEAGIELSVYVILGLGGRALTEEHARETVRLLNRIDRPDFIRLRTLVPKINTLLLHQIKKGRFELLTAHGVLAETRMLVQDLTAHGELASDHYTNYINLTGRLPEDKPRFLRELDAALARPESSFRPLFIGDQ